MPIAWNPWLTQLTGKWGYTRPTQSSKRLIPMEIISLEAKKAYAVKVRQSNYMASLRLEGFKVTYVRMLSTH